MEPAAAENLREDVAWSGDTLAGGAADTDGKRLTHSAPADFDEVRRGFLKWEPEYNSAWTIRQG
jgi:hypothetical protein